MSEQKHGAASTLRRRLLGLGFIALVIGGLMLSVAGQQNAFTDYTKITLETDKVGNQLQVKSDVKARGVIIGHISDIVPSEDGAKLELSLDPAHAVTVPKASSARLLPKTLFGERYVQLEFETLEGPKLEAGDVIPQDRSQAATELGEAFEQLLPVLQAVQPQKLNSTLTAVSNALDGRGTELGKTFKELSDYFAKLQPHMPELQQNLRQLAEFSGNLSDVAPDLIAALDSFRTPAKTIVEKEQQFADGLRTVTKASDELRRYIAANRDNIITVGSVSRPVLALLAKYSPSLPCVMDQMARSVPIIDKALGEGTPNPGLRARAVIGPAEEKYYPREDDPAYGRKIGGKDGEGKDWGTFRGPWCLDPLHPDLPDVLPLPYKFLRFQDGTKQYPDPKSEMDETGIPCDAVSVFGTPVPPVWLKSCAPGTRPKGMQQGGAAAAAGPLNDTPEENALLGTFMGLQYGFDPADMPSWGSMLVGPLFRGAEVHLK